MKSSSTNTNLRCFYAGKVSCKTNKVIRSKTKKLTFILAAMKGSVQNVDPSNMKPIWTPFGPLLDPFWTPSGSPSGSPTGPLLDPHPDSLLDPLSDPIWAPFLLRKCHFLSIGRALTVSLLRSIPPTVFSFVLTSC